MRKLIKLYLTLSILLIASGTSLFFILNLFEIFSSTNMTFTTGENYGVNYAQGSGNLRVQWKLIYEGSNDYMSDHTYITTATGNVEEIGLVYYELWIYVNYYYRRILWLNLSQPSTNYHHSFGLDYLLKDDVVDCIGYADVQFNVSGVVQEETFNFDLSITIPTDTRARLYETDLSLIWINSFLVIGLGVMIIYIAKTIRKIQYERIMSKEDKTRDEEFFEFIKEKSKDKN
ncbi:MAG: hypothetical protein ACFE8L_10415 [Candidatus Hodarchaeota archaeon]